MQKISKGFTIIELIVVIAIIAILAAIVMVNVTQYIAKAKDASIEGNMGSMATDAAVYLDPTSSSPASDTSALCTDTTSGFATAYKSAEAQQASCVAGTNSAYCTCNGSSTDLWASWVQLNNKGTCSTTAWWCVDSAGKTELVCNTAPSSSATACP